MQKLNFYFSVPQHARIVELTKEIEVLDAFEVEWAQSGRQKVTLQLLLQVNIDCCDRK